MPTDYEGDRELRFLMTFDEELGSLIHSLSVSRGVQTGERLLVVYELLKRGEYDTALIWARLAHEASPLSYTARLFLAEARFANGDVGGAEEALWDSMKHVPDPSDDMDWRSYSLRKLGFIAFTNGRLAEAVELLRQAKDISPNYAAALYDFAHYSVVLEALISEERHNEFS